VAPSTSRICGHSRDGKPRGISGCRNSTAPCLDSGCALTPAAGLPYGPGMNRRRFLLTSLTGVLAPPLAAEGQQAGKVYRIGYLSAAGPAPLNTPDAFKDFKDALRGLGYVEGKNLFIDYRFAEGRFDRLPDLAAELVRLKVDIIVTNPTQATAAAKNATETIPIVMISGSVDPVGLGLVASLAHPGGNVTGLSYGASAEIFSKGLELLKETVPKVRRVAILSNPHVLRAELSRSLPARRHLRGQDFEGSQARRPPRRATYEIRARHQPQDRQGSRAHDATVPAVTGGSGYRMTRCCPTSAYSLTAFGRQTDAERWADNRGCNPYMTTRAPLRAGGLPTGAGCVLKPMITGIAAAVLTLAGSVAAQPQQAATVYRIGFVVAGSPGSTTDAFRQALGQLGYVEGKNVVIEARFAEGRQERLPALVAEVIRLKVDVLVVGSTLSAIAAKKATTTIPIVFASLFDPVGAGVVASLAHPGGNITGAAVGVASGFGGKWMELLKEAVPGISHVAVLWNSANPASAQSVQEIQVAARTLSVKFDRFDAGSATALDRALAAISASGAQGIIVAPDPFFTPNRAKLVRFAASKRLPAIYFFRLFADDGGLIAYGASSAESYRSAARQVDKILKGAKPGDLPVEQPTKFELVINLKAAKALGLTIPPSLLLRADQVIE
jgi:putative tryptophan/tyrosine transport system substrate-binding protein